MATIQDYLDQIASAVYGKDVRSAIYNAILQCYKDGSAVSDAVSDLIVDKVESSVTELIEEKISDGTLEVNMSIGDASITEEKIADEAVTPKKTSFMERSRNLFNPYEATNTFQSGSTGSSNSTYTTSEYIPVNGETDYITHILGEPLTATVYITEWDSSYEYIGTTTYDTTAGTFTTSASTAYIKFCYRSAAAHTHGTYGKIVAAAMRYYLQIEEGTTATDLVAYTEGKLSDDYIESNLSTILEPALCRSKNLVDYDAMTTGLLTDGVYSESGTYNVTDYIDVTGIAPSVASLSYAGALHSNGSAFFYDEDKEYMCPANVITNGLVYIPPYAKYMRMQFINRASTFAYPDAEAHNAIGFTSERIIGDAIPVKSRFEGKTISFLGDSFTAMGVFAETAGAYLNAGKIYNWGLSGRMLNTYSDALDTYLESVSIDDIDCLVVLGGENDFSAGYGVGEIDGDTTDKGVKASTCRLIQHIMELAPTITLVFLTPTYRYGYTGSASAGADSDTDSGGYHIREYASGIKEACDYYSVPCLNTYVTSGINTYNVESTTRDGLHPTDDVFKKMGYQCAAFIGNL